MPTITIHDETTAGNSTAELTLDILTETITVRELIRSRVYQEVDDFNRRQRTNPAANFHGLVQPTDTEATLNGYQLKSPRQIHWQPQFEKALEAFQHNRILILIDNHQAASLDQPLTLTPTTRISFLKLIPLVGG